MGISSLENSKFRWPEAGELRAANTCRRRLQPAVDVLWPAELGDQRQQGVVVGGAHHLNGLGVLQVQQQHSAVHDAVDALLKARAGERLGQRAR
jgi:hypothetical protein